MLPLSGAESALVSNAIRPATIVFELTRAMTAGLKMRPKWADGRRNKSGQKEVHVPQPRE